MTGKTCLHRVDVSDPTAPVDSAFCDLYSTAADLAAVEGYLFIADGARGLVILRMAQ